MANRCVGHYCGRTAIVRLLADRAFDALEESGSPSWIRTNDQVINSHLLYR